MRAFLYGFYIEKSADSRGERKYLIWRRERDSNPRRAFDPYTLSRVRLGEGSRWLEWRSITCHQSAPRCSLIEAELPPGVLASSVPLPGTRRRADPGADPSRRRPRTATAQAHRIAIRIIVRHRSDAHGSTHSLFADWLIGCASLAGSRPCGGRIRDVLALIAVQQVQQTTESRWA